MIMAILTDIDTDVIKNITVDLSSWSDFSNINADIIGFIIARPLLPLYTVAMTKRRFRDDALKVAAKRERLYLEASSAFLDKKVKRVGIYFAATFI